MKTNKIKQPDNIFFRKFFLRRIFFKKKSIPSIYLIWVNWVQIYLIVCQPANKYAYIHVASTKFGVAKLASRQQQKTAAAQEWFNQIHAYPFWMGSLYYLAFEKKTFTIQRIGNRPMAAPKT